MTSKDIRTAIKKEIGPAIQELVFEMMTKENVKKYMLEIWDSHEFEITLEGDDDFKISKIAS